MAVASFELSTRTLSFIRGNPIPARFLADGAASADNAPVDIIDELTRLCEWFEAAVRVGGAQFIKMNGRAPTDVECFVPEMRFVLFEEVLLALQNSTRLPTKPIFNELNAAIWREFDRASEFRVFVRKGKICGKLKSDSAAIYEFVL